jgi:hypothetical protein
VYISLNFNLVSITYFFRFYVFLCLYFSSFTIISFLLSFTIISLYNLVSLLSSTFHSVHLSLIFYLLKSPFSSLFDLIFMSLFLLPTFFTLFFFHYFIFSFPLFPSLFVFLSAFSLHLLFLTCPCLSQLLFHPFLSLFYPYISSVFFFFPSFFRLISSLPLSFRLFFCHSVSASIFLLFFTFFLLFIVLFHLFYHYFSLLTWLSILFLFLFYLQYYLFFISSFSFFRCPVFLLPFLYLFSLLPILSSSLFLSLSSCHYILSLVSPSSSYTTKLSELYFWLHQNGSPACRRPALPPRRRRDSFPSLEIRVPVTWNNRRPALCRGLVTCVHTKKVDSYNTELCLLLQITAVGLSVSRTRQ